MRHPTRLLSCRLMKNILLCIPPPPPTTTPALTWRGFGVMQSLDFGINTEFKGSATRNFSWDFFVNGLQLSLLCLSGGLHEPCSANLAQRSSHTDPPHCNENTIYTFLFWELRGLSPNFHNHVSVSDLYIPRIGPQVWLQQKRQTIPGNI